jgi:hypothetical protein
MLIGELQIPIGELQTPIGELHFPHFARPNASKKYKFAKNCRKIIQFGQIFHSIQPFVFKLTLSAIRLTPT